MKRIALLKDNVIVNIAVWDGVADWEPETEFMIDVTEMPTADIGFVFDGENFVDPEGDDG